jgi:microcystin-dependent protein
MPGHTHTATVTSSATLRADVGERRTAKEKDPTGNSLGYGRKKIYSLGEPATAMHPSSIDLSVGVTIGSAGASQSFDLSQPSLVVKFIIAVQGVFPSRS